MLNSKKILVSLLVIAIVTIAFGSIKSLATVAPIIGNVTTSTETANTETGDTVKIGNLSTGTTNNTTNNTTTNNTVNNTTNNTSNSVVNNLANSTRYNTTNSTSLPYAGTNSTTLLIVVALVISAIYAYKKVSDYNV